MFDRAAPLALLCSILSRARDGVVLRALLDYAAAQAVQQRDIGVTAQDRLVALSTCAGSETNGRVVVLGRLCPLKEGDEMQ